jgi:hypothetical protein
MRTNRPALSFASVVIRVGLAGAAGLSVASAMSCASDGDNAPTTNVRSRRATSTSDFKRAVNQIQPGTSKATVVRELGQPDERINGVAGVQRPGPQPPLTINAGSRYEQWVYVRGDSEYHVFLGPSAANPGQWEVHNVAANPRTAVAP